MTSNRQISSINGFNELTLQSTINDSEENDAESDPNSNPKVTTYTTNENSPQKLFINRLIPKIVPGAIRLIDQTITEDVTGIGETLDARQKVLSKDIVTDVACSGAHILWTSRGVSGTGRDGSTPRDVNTSMEAIRFTSPIHIFDSNSNSPTQSGTQDIFNPIVPAGPQFISNPEKLKKFINRFFSEIEILNPVSLK